MQAWGMGPSNSEQVIGSEILVTEQIVLFIRKKIIGYYVKELTCELIRNSANILHFCHFFSISDKEREKSFSNRIREIGCVNDTVFPPNMAPGVKTNFAQDARK